MAYRSTKHGKPIDPLRRGGYGFHWEGRDDEGVSIWQGETGALKWGARILGALGGCEMLGALATWALGVPVAPLVLGGVAALHLGLAYGGVLFLRRFQGLATAEQLAADFHVEPDELEQLIKEGRVRPKAIINLEPHYDTAEFGDAATLLRASRQPDDELLRGAGSAGSSDDRRLLRPEAADGASSSGIAVPKPGDVEVVQQQGNV
jgi:hypothetical protein